MRHFVRMYDCDCIRLRIYRHLLQMHEKKIANNNIKFVKNTRTIEV